MEEFILWQTSYSVDIANLFCLYQFDVVIDLEHTSISFEQLYILLSIYRQANKKIFVRTADIQNFIEINRFFDIGFNGIYLAQVSNSSEIQKIRESTTYPLRGACISTMNQFGNDFDEYNKEFTPKYIPMIENKNALEDIENITSLEFVDSIFIGPYDLSQSLGMKNVQELYESDIIPTIASVAKKNKVKLSGHLVHPEKKTYNLLKDYGYSSLALSTDILLLKNSLDKFLN